MKSETGRGRGGENPTLPRPRPGPQLSPFSLPAEFLRGLFPCSPGARVKADCSLSFTAIDESLLHQLGKRPNCG